MAEMTMGCAKPRRFFCQARVPLGLAFLQGSRQAFKAEDQQLFANLYKDELFESLLGGGVFFPEKQTRSG